MAPEPPSRPRLDPQATDLAAAAPGVLEKLVPGQFNIVLGAELARNPFLAQLRREEQEAGG